MFLSIHILIIILVQTQYQFIEHDLRNAASNTKIDWTFVAESIPIYTSPSDHPADFNIRDIYHPLFDKYGVDLVFSSDNHNYQRTFPLKYNSQDDSSNNPIIADNRQNIYNYNDENGGVIYLITGLKEDLFMILKNKRHSLPNRLINILDF